MGISALGDICGANAEEAWPHRQAGSFLFCPWRAGRARLLLRTCYRPSEHHPPYVKSDLAIVKSVRPICL